MGRITVEGPGLFNKKDGKLYTIESISHSVSIEDGIANFSTVQKFVNSSTEPAELLYRFPLLNGTAPHHLEFEVYDPSTKERTRVVAKINEKKEALKKYDEAISKGDTAVLAEMGKDKHCSLSMGNVKPGCEISIFSNICQDVYMEVGKNGNIRMKVVIPAIHNSKDEGLAMQSSGRKALAIMDVNADIHIHMNRKVESIVSTSHPDSTTYEKINDHEFHFKTTEKVSLEKEMDILIEMVATSKDNVEMINGFVQKCEGGKYASMFSMLPYFSDSFFKGDDSCVPIEHILLIDRSGSMSGRRIELAKQTLKLFAKSLDVDDYPLINVIGFGSSHQKLFEESVPFDEYSLEIIDHHANTELRANLGGTNISDPLQEIANMPPRLGWRRIVYLLTDGEANNSQRCTSIVKSNNDKFRLFCFGIGQGINPTFLTNLSKLTDGRSVFLTDEKKIRQAVVEQMNHSISGQVIRDMNIQFPEGIRTINVNKCTHLFNLQGSFQNYFLEDVKEEMFQEDEETKKKYLETIVSFSVGEDKKKENKVRCYLVKNEEEGEKKKRGRNDFVGVFTALKRIEELKKRIKIEVANKESIEEEMLKLALEFNILTSKTSFIGVKINEEKVEGEMVVGQIKTVPYQQQKKFREEEVSANEWMFARKSSARCDSSSDSESDCSSDERCCDDEDDEDDEIEEEEEEEEDYEKEESTIQPKKRNLLSFFSKKKEVQKEKDSYEKKKKVKKEKNISFKRSRMAPPRRPIQQQQQQQQQHFSAAVIVKKDFKKISFNESLFYKILDLQQIKGNWNEKVLAELGIDLEKVKKEAAAHSFDVQQFITSMIVSLLEWKFKDKEGEWKLMEKKSLKFIGNSESMLEKAKAFVTSL